MLAREQQTTGHLLRIIEAQTQAQQAVAQTQTAQMTTLLHALTEKRSDLLEVLRVLKELLPAPNPAAADPLAFTRGVLDLVRDIQELHEGRGGAHVAERGALAAMNGGTASEKPAPPQAPPRTERPVAQTKPAPSVEPSAGLIAGPREDVKASTAHASAYAAPGDATSRAELLEPFARVAPAALSTAQHDATATPASGSSVPTINPAPAVAEGTRGDRSAPTTTPFVFHAAAPAPDGDEAAVCIRVGPAVEVPRVEASAPAIEGASDEDARAAAACPRERVPMLASEADPLDGASAFAWLEHGPTLPFGEVRDDVQHSAEESLRSLASAATIGLPERAPARSPEGTRDAVDVVPTMGADISRTAAVAPAATAAAEPDAKIEADAEADAGADQTPSPEAAPFRAEGAHLRGLDTERTQGVLAGEVPPRDPSRPAGDAREACAPEDGLRSFASVPAIVLPEHMPEWPPVDTCGDVPAEQTSPCADLSAPEPECGDTEPAVRVDGATATAADISRAVTPALAGNDPLQGSLLWAVRRVLKEQDARQGSDPSSQPLGCAGDIGVVGVTARGEALDAEATLTYGFSEADLAQAVALVRREPDWHAWVLRLETDPDAPPPPLPDVAPGRTAPGPLDGTREGAA